MADKKPSRTYSAEEGQRSVDQAGPNALEMDLDTINTMFDPNATHIDGKPGGIGTSNIKPESFTDMLIGPRTVNDQIADTPADTGTFTQIMSWMARMIRLVTGETNWRTPPAKNFKQVTLEAEEAVTASGSAVTTAANAATTAGQAVAIAETALGEGVEEAGAATETTANTLTHAGKTWAVNSLIGRRVRITSGTKHTRIVTANTADTITVEINWEPGIGSTPTYELEVATISGAEGATMTAEAVQWDYAIKRPEIEQAVIDANNAVASVASKADIEYVNNEIISAKESLVLQIDRKEAVATFADIALTYPIPEDGWLVFVKDTRNHYVYNAMDGEWQVKTTEIAYADAVGTDGIITSEKFVALKGLLDGAGVNGYAVKTGDYEGLRARATTKEDVGLTNVANVLQESKEDADALRTDYALFKEGAFEFWSAKAGHTYTTTFNPDGSILKELRNTISNVLVASKDTQFNTPSAGQITELLYVVDAAVTIAKVTTFNPDGSISEVITEVV